jgi:chemotaxis protein CheD
MSSKELPSECLSVGIGQWRIARAPVGLRAILGSCVGVVIYDRISKLGALAHILLPNSRGNTDHPGRFADTAIPVIVDELCRLRGPLVKSNLVARLAGGAKMFETQGGISIGESNHLAVLCMLEQYKIPVLASDVGGEQGRNLTFDTQTGRMFVKKTGGTLYEV